jgi:hypothetical protein
MNKYKLLGILSAALVIVFGVVYLKVGSSFLSPALIMISVSILAMGIFSLLESRSRGERGVAALIPAICLMVLSVAVLIAWIYVMIN